jgi:hypothetical protein
MTVPVPAPSPLGKYGDVVAAFASGAVIVAWLVAHMLPGLGADASALDTSAIFVLGVILGQRTTTNGAAKVAQAAHQRLDAIHAPPTGNGA